PHGWSVASPTSPPTWFTRRRRWRLSAASATRSSKPRSNAPRPRCSDGRNAPVSRAGSELPRRPQHPRRDRAPGRAGSRRRRARDRGWRGVCSWVVMVQREVGERLAAAPATPAYGATSVLAQLACDVNVLRPVARTVFRPVPNVDSALVGLRRHGAWGDPGVVALVHE